MMKLLISVLMIMSCYSYATSRLGRESGGGEVFGDALNPWFLENTKTVTYCIEVDPVHFGTPLDSLEPIVESSLKIWKDTFSKAQAKFKADKDIKPYGMVRIATQEFVKESCRPSTDLRFQFGVLSKEQRKKDLTDPQAVVAETIRTSYDEVNLRGKGFIYVAPEKGPDHPKGLNMAPHPWAFRQGLILKRVLLHELGHVFGLSHSGSAYEIMGQAHPEYLVLATTLDSLSNQSFSQLNEWVGNVAIFGVEFPFEQTVCQQQNTIRLKGTSEDNLFGLPENSLCQKFVFTEDHFELYSSEGEGHPYSLIGKAVRQEYYQETKSLLRIKLNVHQTVFQSVPETANVSGYLVGALGVTRKDIKYDYHSNDGLFSAPIKAEFLSSQKLKLTGIFNGKFVEVFR